MPEASISILLMTTVPFLKGKKLFLLLLSWALVSMISNMKWNKLTVSKYNLVCMHDNTKCPFYFFLSSPSSRPVWFFSKYDMILFDWTNILESSRHTDKLYVYLYKKRERKTEKMSESSIKSQKLELFHVQFRFMDSHKCIISRIKLQIQESKCVRVCTLILIRFCIACIYCVLPFIAILSIYVSHPFNIINSLVAWTKRYYIIYFLQLFTQHHLHLQQQQQQQKEYFV